MDGKFGTDLSGDNELPPRETDGCGDAMVKFNAYNKEMAFEVKVKDQMDVRFAHFLYREKGF